MSLSTTRVLNHILITRPSFVGQPQIEAKWELDGATIHACMIPQYAQDTSDSYYAPDAVFVITVDNPKNPTTINDAISISDELATTLAKHIASHRPYIPPAT